MVTGAPIPTMAVTARPMNNGAKLDWEPLVLCSSVRAKIASSKNIVSTASTRNAVAVETVLNSSGLVPTSPGVMYKQANTINNFWLPGSPTTTPSFVAVRSQKPYQQKYKVSAAPNAPATWAPTSG